MTGRSIVVPFTPARMQAKEPLSALGSRSQLNQPEFQMFAICLSATNCPGNSPPLFHAPGLGSILQLMMHRLGQPTAGSSLQPLRISRCKDVSGPAYSTRLHHSTRPSTLPPSTSTDSPFLQASALYSPFVKGM